VEELKNNETRKHLVQLIQGLPNIQREIVTLHFFGELKNKEIELKEKEMKIFATYLFEKNDFIDKIKKKLIIVKQKKNIDDVTNELNNVMTHILQLSDLKNEQLELEERFYTIHQSFKNEISKKFPTLTENEKRLLMLIKLDYSNKEIASIINVELKSVFKFRYRIQKKMNHK